MTAHARPGWRQLAGGSLALAAVRVGGMGCGLLLMVFLARTVTPDALGAVTLCFSTAMIGGLLASANIGAGAVRFVTEYARQPETAPLAHGYHRYGQQTVLATASIIWVALAVIGAGEHLANVTLLPDPIIVGLALAPLFAWLRIAAANVAATGAVLRSALPATLLRPALLLCTVLALFVLAGGMDSSVVLLAYGATLVLVVLLQWPLFRRVLAPLTAAPAAQPPGLRAKWLRVGLNLLVPALFLELFVDIVVLFSALVVDDAQLGALGIVLRVQGIVLFLVTSINMVMSPRIAAAHAVGQRDEVRRLLLISTHLKLWPSLAALAVLALAGDRILGLFAPIYASYQGTLLILATTPLIMALIGPVVLFVTVLGLEREARKAFGAALVLLLALVVTLGGTFALPGIGVAVVVVWALWQVWLYRIIRRQSGYSTVCLR